MSHTLPKSWASAPLNALGTWLGGGTPSKSNPAYWQHGTVHWVSPKDMKRLLIDSAQDQITKKAVRESATNLIPADSVLIVTRSGILAHSFPVGINTIAVAINQDLKAWTSLGAVGSTYVAYFLKSRAQQILRECSKDGTTVSSIDFDRLSAYPVAIAPANEQHRIVSKIDELFSRIDEGEQALKRVAKLVERYRQSVLKAAVTGELTRDWREARKRAGEPVESGAALLDRILKARRAAWEQAELAKLKTKGKTPTDDRWKQKYKEPAPPNTTDLPELPKGWVWASLEQLLARIDAGKSFKCEERPPRPSEYGIVKVSAVTWGSYDESESKTITDSSRIQLAYLIRPGDFLFSRANTIELVGACTIAHTAERRLLLSDKILRFVFVMDVREWCDLVLKSRLGREQIESLSTGNQESMRNIGQQRIGRIAIPLPSIREMGEIVRCRAQGYEGVRELQLATRGELQRSASLRQSILKAAFSGQLVPQDPNDEPASKLLERIAAERAGGANTQHKRTKKTA